MTKEELKSRTKAANYRAACRAKSKADFIYKIDVVIEEADETMYWLEIMGEAGLLNIVTTESLIKEANELVSIFTAASITSKAKYRDKKQ